MTPFLKQVARQYFADEDKLSHTLFVFPSRRAIVFFHKYLAEVTNENGRPPLFTPKALTMDEFLLSLSDVQKADRIVQLLELYTCYGKVCAQHGLKPDSLDDFIFWGDMILADFNDIDKYLVDAKDLLRNIAQYKKIQDDFSYLSETQRAAIEKFMRNFDKMGKYKQLFAEVWDLLYPIYVSFNEAMTVKGLAYEGAVYRQVAAKVAQEGAAAVLAGVYPECERVVFCGLNALNECEKKVMDSLKRLNLAQFCWDYASPMIKDSENRSSFFMRDNIERFGNDISLEPCNTVPDIEVISVSSSIGQAKLLDVIMKENPSVKPDETTAVMLADETLLLPVLSSIPPQVPKINVTMGYPMESSSFYALIEGICGMILRTRQKDGKTQIYHKMAWSIAGNNIFTALADNDTKAKVALMKKSRRYYVDSDSLSGTPLLDMIFSCPEMNPEAIRQYLLKTVDFIGRSIASNQYLKAEMALEMDFAMECSKVLNLLEKMQLDLSPSVWLHVLKNLLSSTSIPFSGEPLRGLQIMGPLEMRALDFDNLIIMSANESMFPRKRVASSFIPPLLRINFGLPTYEYQDAVWAYYFYRMIQRPAKVWMILDSRPDGLNSGEESRYIKQLRYHFRVPITFRYASSSPTKREQDCIVPKTDEIMQKLHSRPISATSIERYINCPMKFYFNFIEGLKNEDQVSETLDGGMIGNVFHNTMEALFKDLPGHKVTREVLENMRKDKAGIMEKVRANIADQLKCDELRGREVVFARIVLKNIIMVLGWDIELLEKSGFDHFIATTEVSKTSQIGGFDLCGRIDRLDVFPDGSHRIVDYKTGKVDKNKFAIQLFIYSYLVNKPNISTYIYSTRTASSSAPEALDLDGTQKVEVEAQIMDALKLMDDRQVPFTVCEDSTNCKYCDFSNICPKCSK